MLHRARALGHPAFRRLWAAQVVSEAGDWMALVAAAAMVYRGHGSPVESGLVFVAGLLPQVGIGQWLSTFADRYSRRAAMLLADAVRAGAFLLLGLGGPELPTPVVLLVMFVAACCTEPFNSARSAAILDQVPGEAYESAVWVDSLTQDLTQAAGFVLGGVLVATVSPATGLLVNAGTFAVSFVLVAGVPAVRPDGPPAPPTALAAVAAAVRYLAGQATVRSLIVTAVLSEAVATATDAAVVPFVAGLGPGFGWLTAVILGGSAAATLVVTAAVVRDVTPDRAYRMIRALVAVPVVAVPLLLSGAWWAQSLGLGFAAALSVPLVPAAMVVNPMLPANMRATCRSVIVGGMVLAQVAVVWAVSTQVARLGAPRTVAIGFVLLALCCVPLLSRPRHQAGAASQ